jgi:hypothetical protein
MLKTEQLINLAEQEITSAPGMDFERADFHIRIAIANSLLAIAKELKLANDISLWLGGTEVEPPRRDR